MHSHGSPAGLKCTFKFPPICSERVMYVDTITHARVHVWLCDNAGPAWQAPRIIALGRELHNNVGLGNACGLGLSAVSGPVNVALLALHVSAATHTRTHTHWHTHIRYEKSMGHHSFHVWRSAAGFHFSSEWWNYSKSIRQVPLLTP